MVATREQRIRDRAYALWEQEGRPHGRHAEHWRRAADELDAQDGSVSPASAAPAVDTPPPEPRRRVPASRAEPAAPPAPRRTRPKTAK